MQMKTVVLDAKTIAGNRWLNNFLDSNGAIKAPMIVNDADGCAAYYISQLASIETTIYEVPYADITYLEDVPVVGNIPEFATHWNYRSYDGVAMGKFISANATDLPRVAQSAKLHQVDLGYAGVECHYSLDELRTTSSQNMPVDTMQAELAYRGSEEHSQRVAYFGDSARNMFGMFNSPNVTKTSAAVNFATCTGQELFDLLNKPVFSIIKLSKNFHIPNTALMPPDLWARATNLLMTGYTDRSVMEHFMINNSYTKLTGKELTIKVRFQLEAAELAKNGISNSNKDRYVVYDKSERNLALAKPIPFRMLAPQLAGLAITVPAEYKISGTEYRYPLCAQYVDML